MREIYKITEEYVPYVTGETRKVEKKLEGNNGIEKTVRDKGGENSENP